MPSRSHRRLIDPEQVPDRINDLGRNYRDSLSDEDDDDISSLDLHDPTVTDHVMRTFLQSNQLGYHHAKEWALAASGVVVLVLILVCVLVVRALGDREARTSLEGRDVMVCRKWLMGFAADILCVRVEQRQQVLSAT